MKHFIIVLISCVLSLQGISQDIFMTRSGEITFFSSTPIEDIEADNKSVTCILKTQTGELAFKLFMKSFSFERAAMQEHFNHDYVHSDEFPKSTFSGRISNSEPINYSEIGTYEVDVEGELTIHGVTKPVSEQGTIEVKDGKILLASVFAVQLEDYNVKVPSNFTKKINKEIEIRVKAELEPYER